MWWYAGAGALVALVAWVAYEIGEMQGYRYGVHVGKTDMRDHVVRIMTGVN